MTRYNISLSKTSNETLKELAIMAATSNGGYETTLLDLQERFERDKLKYPHSMSALQIIVSDHSLVVYNATIRIILLTIEQVEVTELAGMENGTDKFIDDINNGFVS